MKTGLVLKQLALITLVMSWGVGASIAQEVTIHAPTFMNETQKQADSPQRIGMAWWMPNEFWAVTNPDMPASQLAMLYDTFEPYLIVAVADGTVGPLGGVTFVDEDQIRSSTQVVDRRGNIYTTLDPGDLSADANNMVLILQPMLANMLGQMGTNMHVLFFPAHDSEGVQIADAKAEGSFALRMGGNLEHRWRLPLGSVLPPKICPEDGEELSGAWSFCPWHGAELESPTR